MRNLYVGDVVTFKYDGGTHPGSVRTVCILEVGKTIQCWDFNKKLARNFSFDKISDVTYRDAKLVELDTLPGNIHPNTIVEGFEQEGLSAFHSENTNSVYAVKLQPKEPEVTANVYIQAENQDMCVPLNAKDTLNVYLNVFMGKCLGMYITNGVMTIHHGNEKITNPTTAQLKAWVNHLG